MTASSRIAACATLVAICVSGASVLAQRAGSIAGISPGAARPGDLVTIAGNGFGAFNARVTVGGVPALVTAATGREITFRVPVGVPQGATRVTAINPGGQSGSIAFQIIEGVLLSGAANALATSAETLRLPTPANRTDIDGGLILTRLNLRITADATVGQVNAALLLVNGGIDSMHPGGLALTIAIPRQPSIEAIQAIINRLRSAPGVAFTFESHESAPLVLPSDPKSVGAQLFPTRFPAAWNARRLAQQDCTSRRVPILVVDAFSSSPPAGYSQLGTELPLSSFALTDTPPTTETHGWDVATTMAAAFNGTTPTGANPFVECLDIIGVNVAGLGPYAETEEIVWNFPSSNFLINYSRGWLYQCPIVHSPTLNADTCDPAWVNGKMKSGFARAVSAAEFKHRTHDSWNDFLAFAAAGNANDASVVDGMLAVVYPGVAKAFAASMVNSVTNFDPFFGFAGDSQLWDRQFNDPNLPSSFTADAAALAQIHDAVVQDGIDTVGGAPNIVIVGSATAGKTFATLDDSTFSNPSADIAAVGEEILTIDGGTTQGTSFAAPQATGLASYLWLLSDELRNRPDSIEKTRRAIEDNARVLRGISPVIDAYASILSLDQAVLPAPSTAPVRLALLDANDDTFFTELDIDAFLAHLLDSGTPVEPLDPDYSRFDLNGDGFTGGTIDVESFDLDRIGSEQFGRPAPPSDVTQVIEGSVAHFDERGLTDLQILCYYAYSALYTGDPTARAHRLTGYCGIDVEVTPGHVQLSAGATQQFSATVRGSSDPRVTWTATGGTITNTGLYTAGTTQGTFSVRATSVADPSRSGSATIDVSAASVGIPGRWVGQITELRPFGFLSHDLTVNVSGSASAISGSFVITPIGTEPTLTGTLTATMDGTRVLSFSMTLDAGQCPEDAPFTPLDTVASTSGSFLSGTNSNIFRTGRDPNVPFTDWLHGQFLCVPDANGPFLYNLQPIEIVFQGPF